MSPSRFDVSVDAEFGEEATVELPELPFGLFECFKLLNLGRVGTEAVIQLRPELLKVADPCPLCREGTNFQSGCPGGYLVDHYLDLFISTSCRTCVDSKSFL